MLGIGFWEIIVVLLIAFIVLGHEGCIDAAKKTGRWLRIIQRELGEVHKGIDDIETKIKDDLRDDRRRKEDIHQAHREDSKTPPT